MRILIGMMPRLPCALWKGVAAACLLLLVLGPALSGCQTNAQDEDFNFNNPLDPNPDDGDDDDGDNTGQIVISYVDDLNDIVILVNTGIEDTSMTGWKLQNDDGSIVYTFPGFTLDAGKFVRVHSDTGDDETNDLFAGTNGVNWGNSDPNAEAFLFDDSGDPIDNCLNGSACWP